MLFSLISIEIGVPCFPLHCAMPNKLELAVSFHEAGSSFCCFLAALRWASHSPASPWNSRAARLSVCLTPHLEIMPHLVGTAINPFSGSFYVMMGMRNWDFHPQVSVQPLFPAVSTDLIPAPLLIPFLLHVPMFFPCVVFSQLSSTRPVVKGDVGVSLTFSIVHCQTRTDPFHGRLSDPFRSVPQLLRIFIT